jgi:peptide-methionine (S)-S-oxide reductase
MPVPEKHLVNGHRIVPPFPEGTELVLFGMGCFWGAERIFWKMAGVYSTAVGYAAGITPNPTYREVCSGMTGHNEVVRVVFEPAAVRYEDLLQAFWEHHDPTQGMRQGTTLAPSTARHLHLLDRAQRAPPSRRATPPAAPAHRRFRRDHHQIQPAPESSLRRGGAPAVPGESRRLLRPGRYWRELPGRVA